jgi:AcrR family transcriptional regulator
MKMMKQNTEETTKEKIVKCAFDLFADKGIKETSMREIAQAAKLTKPVIYYYFKDKDELCLEIIRHFSEMQNQLLSNLIATTPNLLKFLEALFTTCLEDVKNKKMLGFIMHLHSYVSSHPEIMKKLIIFKHGYRNILEDFLKQKIKEGELREDMFDIALHLISASTIYMMHSTKEHRTKFKANSHKEMAKAILRAVSYKGEIK